MICSIRASVALATPEAAAPATSSTDHTASKTTQATRNPLIDGRIALGLRPGQALTSAIIAKATNKPMDQLSDAGRPDHRVAYQGVPGAYSEVAARKACPHFEPLPCDQFEVCFQVRRDGRESRGDGCRQGKGVAAPRVLGGPCWRPGASKRRFK